MPFPQVRLRRLRTTAPIRRLVREHRIDKSQLIAPLFVVEGKGVRLPVASMPGVFQMSIDELVAEARAIAGDGIDAVLLFGSPAKKDARASGARDPDGLIPDAVRAIKEKLPGMIVATDVCLCGYTDHGHCGLTDKDGRILNDESLDALSEMAVAHAKAGADIVAPSDMMDGRVAAVRRALDGSGLADAAIMSHAAKYASCFYGPFRDAAHSAPASGDRRTYQMDVSNAREALREIRQDAEEGADIIMIKPAMPCLDIIAAARRAVDVPIAAYQVSGEFAMIRDAAAKGHVDERLAIEESLTAIRRAGADIIVTYFARELGRVVS